MAAPALLIRSARVAAKALLALALTIIMVMLAAWAGSAIPRNAGWREPREGIELMLETNGFHTAIVMPAVTSVKDWRDTFPEAARITPSGAVTHIAVGWGEEQVFLHTPTWWDLEPSAVLRIARPHFQLWRNCPSNIVKRHFNVLITEGSRTCRAAHDRVTWACEPHGIIAYGLTAPD